MKLAQKPERVHNSVLPQFACACKRGKKLQDCRWLPHERQLIEGAKVQGHWVMQISECNFSVREGYLQMGGSSSLQYPKLHPSKPVRVFDAWLTVGFRVWGLWRALDLPEGLRWCKPWHSDRIGLYCWLTIAWSSGFLSSSPKRQGIPHTTTSYKPNVLYKPGFYFIFHSTLHLDGWLFIPGKKGEEEWKRSVCPHAGRQRSLAESSHTLRHCFL